MAITTGAEIIVRVAQGQPNETPRRTPDQVFPPGRSTVMTIAELGTLLGVGAGPGGFPVALLQDQKAAASGGTFTSGAARVRDLNTEVQNDIGLVLAANRFTLLEGTYVFRAECPGHRVGGHQAWLVEDPGGSPSIIMHGTSVINVNDTTDGSDGPTVSVIEGIIVAAAATEYEINHQCATTKTTNGFGNVGAFQTTPSIFTQVKLTKIV